MARPSSSVSSMRSASMHAVSAQTRAVLESPDELSREARIAVSSARVRSPPVSPRSANPCFATARCLGEPPQAVTKHPGLTGNAPPDGIAVPSSQVHRGRSFVVLDGAVERVGSERGVAGECRAASAAPRRPPSPPVPARGRQAPARPSPARARAALPREPLTGSGGQGVPARTISRGALRLGVVRRNDTNQFLVVQALVVRGRCKVLGASLRLGQRPVRHLADQPLDEAVLATFRRSGIGDEPEQLLAHQIVERRRERRPGRVPTQQRAPTPRSVWPMTAMRSASADVHRPAHRRAATR